MIFLIAYLIPGIYMTATTRSRGILADFLFAILWPIYLIYGD